MMSQSTTATLPQKRVGRMEENGIPLGRGIARAARGLGWLSIALGVAQVLAPDALGELLGLHRSARNRARLRELGLREIAAGASILGFATVSPLVEREATSSRLAKSHAKAERERLRHTQAITVNRSYTDLTELWASFDDESKSVIDSIRYEGAPGGRGTEMHVRHQTLDSLRAKSVLRRFKQFAETGEVLHSDASIHKGPHPAQPSKISHKGTAR